MPARRMPAYMQARSINRQIVSLAHDEPERSAHLFDDPRKRRLRRQSVVDVRHRVSSFDHAFAELRVLILRGRLPIAPVDEDPHRRPHDALGAVKIENLIAVGP